MTGIVTKCSKLARPSDRHFVYNMKAKQHRKGGKREEFWSQMFG